MLAGFAGKIYRKYDGSAFDLLSEVVVEALEMAGMEMKQLDGLVTTQLPGIFDGKANLLMSTNQVRQYLGLKARYVDTLDFGGASALASVHRAYKAIRAGEAESVLCLIGGKASDVRAKGVTVDSIDRAYPDISISPFDEFLRVYDDLNPVSDYALAAFRHSKLFGTTDEQRARIAAQQRFNAKGSAKALFKDDLTPEQVLASPMVAEPLHLLEIVYPADGFHAFIVSKKQTRLRALDIIAYGEGHWHELPPEQEDIVSTPAVESSRRASFEAGKADAYELYDSFTITTLMQIEDIGLTRKGKGGEFVEKHDLTFRGDVPLNTGGGSLNLGQPGFMSGGVLLEEALLQLNGMAEGHQVSGVNRVYLNGIGGWSRSHSVTLVLGEKN
ncbi:MAG: thiolase family protein [Nitrososphaerota archaeon]|nr:thiolase family protein [Nitrososphaerota archaeon]